MIKSKDNEKYKSLKKLKQKKYRDRSNLFLVFGDHLIDEAKKHGTIIEIFTTNEDKEGTLIDFELMKELSFTETIFESLALCEKKDKEFNNTNVLILEDVQDPDNVGALIRSASAFNFMHVIVSNNSADVYNDKTIRASQGAIFHVKIERTNIYDKVLELKEKGYYIYATDVSGTNGLKNKEKIGLVLGNEGSGVSSEIRKIADESLTIKTSNVESLNVSIAGAILMYEVGKK